MAYVLTSEEIIEILGASQDRLLSASRPMMAPSAPGGLSWGTCPAARYLIDAKRGARIEAELTPSKVLPTDAFPDRRMALRAVCGQFWRIILDAERGKMVRGPGRLRVPGCSAGAGAIPSIGPETRG